MQSPKVASGGPKGGPVQSPKVASGGPTGGPVQSPKVASGGPKGGPVQSPKVESWPKWWSSAEAKGGQIVLKCKDEG